MFPWSVSKRVDNQQTRPLIFPNGGVINAIPPSNPTTSLGQNSRDTVQEVRLNGSSSGFDNSAGSAGGFDSTTAAAATSNFNGATSSSGSNSGFDGTSAAAASVFDNSAGPAGGFDGTTTAAASGFDGTVATATPRSTVGGTGSGDSGGIPTGSGRWQAEQQGAGSARERDGQRIRRRRRRLCD